MRRVIKVIKDRKVLLNLKDKKDKKVLKVM